MRDKETNCPSGDGSVPFVYLNTTVGTSTTVPCGSNNASSYTNAAVKGGWKNWATGIYGMVVVGKENEATEEEAVVEGCNNGANGPTAVVMVMGRMDNVVTGHFTGLASIMLEKLGPDCNQVQEYN